MREIRTAALIGMGAMGAVFAPGLSATLGDGFRVVAGGVRKARLARGVMVNGAPVTFRLTEPEGPAEPVDLVILAVKDYAYREALEQVGRFVGEDTILLPVLNGLDCARQAGEVYGPEKVLYASMWVDASMENGTAVYNPRGMVRIGEARNDPPGPRVLALEDLFRRAGVRCRVEPDMIHCIWLKFMGNVSENLPCALLGVPYGAYREGWPADGIRRALMAEVAAVARAEAGVELTEEDMALRNRIVYNQDPASRPSTLQDLDRGRQTEVGLFAGAVVRLGEKHGIPTPVSAVMLQGIRALEAKNAGTIPGLPEAARTLAPLF